MLRGRDGRDGLPGPPGAPGKDGRDGEKGERGMKGERGQLGGSVVYTRWGRTVCPNNTGTQLVYSGIVGGAAHNAAGGGGANYICLTNSANYSDYEPGVLGYSMISGTSYGSVGQQPLIAVRTHGTPCAVCLVTTRSSHIMIPGTFECPDGWTREYDGYLMAGATRWDRNSKMYVCVDSDPESIPGTAGGAWPAIFYHVEASCNNQIPCPPYSAGKELTCVVCSI